VAKVDKPLQGPLYTDSTNISNMNNMSAALGVFLVCCRTYL